jgi:hypothetical protein
VNPSSKLPATNLLLLPYRILYNEIPLYSMEGTGLIDLKNCMEIVEI